MGGTRLPASALARMAATRLLRGDLALLRRAQEDRALVLLRAVHTRLRRRPEAVGPEAHRAFEAHWALLARAEARRPAVARFALGYPAVGARLVAVVRAADGAELEWALAAFGAAAVAVALLTGTACTADLAAPEGVLALPGVGVLRAFAPGARVSVRAGGAWVRPLGHRRAGAAVLRLPGTGAGAGSRPRWTAVGVGWRQPARLPGSAARLEDIDPFRVPPGGVGLPGLEPRPAAERDETAAYPWAARWDRALALLLTADPVRAAEIGALVRAVVPLGAAPSGGGGGRVSATTRAVPGALLTTWPGSAAQLAAVLVHETHHTKLDLVHELAPLHGSEAGEREGAAGGAAHRVGWRPDPRPVRGVLHGTYAHLALADLWARLAGAGTVPERFRRAARDRHEQCWEQVREALPILLNSSELTYAGRQFAIGMSEYHQNLGKRVRPRHR
ncbi:aKG-HExxH-type peptide beta-hydroxylase [Streptomyces sp. WMMC1477]|uniref:aKG-HExxH-type peptide beta-hydroxylase n=1 Tax=Streptomyces sp. WMMC1477 TaxID=3015155 RepID=UPI0022B6785F|nr:HEXXH motif-containing putative peptide modification protein [Streptomyces sp. WMMC1477]MCZ7433610.1 HEXXH motif-containing putative peptide modification protein [Streptomyces sp. WMMC1477]